MGYRKIADYLNEQGIKTARGNTWKNTQVFSVLKKYRQRLDRIKNVRQFDHGIEIGKFELKWMKILQTSHINEINHINKRLVK